MPALRMQNHLLSLIIFAPLAGAAINWLVGRRLRNERFIGLVACGSVAISAILGFYLAFKSGGALRSTQPVMDHLWTWIQVGNFRADFGLAMDRLSGIYVLFITFVGFLIHVFATGYMHGDGGYYRFFAYLNLFMFAMLTLILGDNFLLMFVGWEGVGLCSYLLIGFYLDKAEAAPAAKKAFVANRVGDWGFVMGILLLFWMTSGAGAPSISFFDKPGVASALQTVAHMPIDGFTWHAIFAGGISSIAVLLFIGATGKSAQIPLYVWLPDAMAGPTPVSALIHAATMVTAGVYMLARCSAIFTHAPFAMFIVAIVGAATALFAATIGLAQNDIKKVLAYSTISQLGYMFLACGVGAFIAAIFHVMTHAFFKAQLFLGSGSVIHGMHHEQDMRRMGGLRKYMPITWLTMCCGWLAICGVPIWAGFFSKDEILWKVWVAGSANMPAGAAKALWFVGIVTALLTAVYMTRLMVMTFWGDERFSSQHDAHGESHADDHHAVTPHESPWSMTVPLIVLAMLSTVGGFVGVPYAISSLAGGHPINYFEEVLAPAISTVPATHAPEGEATKLHWQSPPPQEVDGKPAVAPVGEAPGAATEHEIPSPQELNEERLLALVSVLIALSGIGIGWLMFERKPLRAMPRLLENKYYVDEIYDAAIIQPINVGSREGLWKIFDIGVIDGIIHLIGGAVVRFGRTIRYMQIGFVRGYAAIILAGALIIIGYFAYSGAHVLRFLVR
ncbi:MAG TPA: NADH-quinone oxidoreductase subunit L [Pyrinomonadaceae bacterium]|nr:NADH-quinone oxidoreductase subunit L [Pyrinomonadaceae bacterium]